MGFGWFGLSTFWLLALCWPGVRGLLGGEIRIFGPGTLRMLLGVPLAVVSSATLAALTGGDSTAAGGSVGQSLSHGLSVSLGGTLAMGVAGFVLLFSLPLVFGTTWWGMFTRTRPADDDAEASSHTPRFDSSRREPARGLSQMSFDTSERAERGERGERFTPTLGQGHHNVGSLTEEPVPRRRGLAAQPRWKLSDEERARLDAMQPPPLTTRGAPRAEPSFTPASHGPNGSNGLGARPAGKGTSVGRNGAAVAAAAVAASAGAATTNALGARVVSPRGSYASGSHRGDALGMSEFVRAEPGLAPREARGVPPAAPRSAPSASSAPAPAAVNATATADPLHSTSIPGATGYRRPVGMAPAHLRGTIVHSPFRKPQLGLEDVPPRGAPPMAPRLDDGQSTPAAVADGVAPSRTTAELSNATTARAASSAIRGAAMWSATDAATPLSSDFAEFSPVDLSVKPAEMDVLPPAPTPEMLAQQEAARAAELAEQARAKALAALREEAQALLRDLRDWTSSDATQPVDASAATSAGVPESLDTSIELAPAIGIGDTPFDEVVHTEMAIEPPANIAVTSQVVPATIPAPAPAPLSPASPFVFADVLGSVEAVEAIDVRASESHIPMPSPVLADTADVPLATQTPLEVLPDVSPLTEAPQTPQLPEPADVSTMSDVLGVSDMSDAAEVAQWAHAVDATDAPMAMDAMSKPHYVIRADGTWSRADEASSAHDDFDSGIAPPASLAAPAPVVVPALSMPAFTPSTAIPSIPSFAASAAEPVQAAFTADTPYELPPPRVAIDYDLPSLDLLSPATAQDVANVVSDDALAAVSQLIEQRLAEFKVPVTVVGASAGPVITRFEVEPAVGVRGAQVVGLMKDLARALGVTSIRVVETIPGKTCMGLELPNAQRQMIRLSEILTAPVFDAHRSHLALAMGKDITGEPVVADLARAPHLLVAGTTGSGKSVAVNAMILSLLYKATPDDVRLIMIDPKMLELSVYGGIPHLLAPVVTDMKQAAHALNWCVGEMEKRYRLMSALGVRNLAGYNDKIDAAHAAGEKVSNPFSLTPDAPEPLDRLPFIVVVIDELADLMMVAGKKIEELIARLAQKARAAGIHLILATQRPSVDVITGLIKANIPTRVAFQVSSKIDSRTILDQMGAESLLGQGDMLFLPPGTGYPQRVHGAFVADDEVHRVVQHWQQYGEPDYDEAILAGDPGEGAAGDLFGDASGDAEADPLYDEAAAFVLNSRRASISAVQRQLRIGYNRAARLIEQMEAAGLVTPMGRNGAREVVAPGD